MSAMLSAAHSDLQLTLISFFQHLIPKVTGSIVIKFWQCLMVTWIYKTGSETWGPSPKIWRPKNIKIWTQFWTTSQLDQFPNISGMTKISLEWPRYLRN